MEKTVVHQPDLFEENLKKAGLDGVQAIKKPLKHWSFCHTGIPPKLNLLNDTSQNTLYFPEDVDSEQLLWLSMHDLTDIELLIVYGVGLGYGYLTLKPWLEKNPDHQLLLIEDDPEILHAFLETSAASEFLSDSQCTLIYKDEAAEWQERIVPLIKNTFFLKRKFVSSFKYTLNRSQDCARMEIQTDILFFYAAQAEGEYLTLGVDFQKNFFNNFLNLYLMKLGTSLKGKFKDVPAIICGAGPSLEKQAEALKSVKDRALIFAGGTAMNALNVLGIMPHFGAGLDPFEPQMSRIMENDAFMIPYFIKYRMYSGAVEALLGEKLLIPQDMNYPIVKELETKVDLQGENQVELGANVIHFCVSLAEMLGCSPIIMVGVDLAYTEGAPYSKGVQVHATYEPFDQLVSKTSHEELMLVQDIYGKPIYTLPKWLFEALWYSAFQSAHPDTALLNGTEGGIGFQGIPNVSFQEVITSFKEKGDLLGRIDAAMAEVQAVTMPSFDDARNLASKLFEDCERIAKGLLQRSSEERKTYVLEEIEKNEILNHSIKPFYALIEGGAHEKLPSFEIRKKKMPSQEMIAEQLIITTYQQLYFSLNEQMQRYLDLSKQVQQASPVPSERHEKYEDKEFDEKSGTGFKRRHDELGAVLEEAYYVADQLNGTVRHFSNRGALLGESWFVNGLRDGIQKAYFPSGALYAEKSYLKGIEEGIHRYYFPSGILRAEVSYKNGVKEGSSKIFYENGVLKRVVNYEKGLRNGPDLYFSEGSRPLSEAHYLAGKPYGIAKVWWASGAQKKEIAYFLPGVIYRAIYFDEKGQRIAAKEQTSEFYDVIVRRSSELQKKMNSLMLSLKTLFANQSPEDAEVIRGLQDEMEVLGKLSGILQKDAGVQPGEYKEPIWKSSQSKELMLKAIESMSQPIVQILEEIHEKLQKLQARKKNGGL